MENREVERRLAFAKAVALKAGDFLLSHEELSGKVRRRPPMTLSQWQTGKLRS